jgi:CubicO group peptidase (beta-lactamase class C family)
MLLAHTAGLPNWRWINPDRKLDLKFDPGSRYVYSGEGIELLQLIVEERTGKPLAQLMEERVFGPMGMRDTGMISQADKAERAVTHYAADGAPKAHRQRRTASAAGSMDTTLEDMARLLAGVLRGEAAPPGALEQMLRPQLAIVSPQQFPSHWPGETAAFAPVRLSVGLGWILFDSPRGPVFFKEGSDDGTINLLLGFRQQRSGIVVLSNSSNATRLMAPLLRAVYGEFCLPWYWMGYVADDVTLAADARLHPPVTPGCGPELAR